MKQPTIKFDDLPCEALVRLPTTAGVMGISAATVWRKVRDRVFPAPIKLGARISVWRKSELQEILKATAAGADAAAMQKLVARLEEARK